jgi:hypothetical protein
MILVLIQDIDNESAPLTSPSRRNPVPLPQDVLLRGEKLPSDNGVNLILSCNRGIW